MGTNKHINILTEITLMYWDPIGSGSNKSNIENKDNISPPVQAASFPLLLAPTLALAPATASSPCPPLWLRSSLLLIWVPQKSSYPHYWGLMIFSLWIHINVRFTTSYPNSFIDLSHKFISSKKAVWKSMWQVNVKRCQPVPPGVALRGIQKCVRGFPWKCFVNSDLSVPISI